MRRQCHAVSRTRHRSHSPSSRRCAVMRARTVAAVCAGNVMPFPAPDTEATVLARITAHLRDDGLFVVGFGLDRGYPLADFDTHTAAAGLVPEHRFATWDLRPWRDDAPFAVTVLRRPRATA